MPSQSGKSFQEQGFLKKDGDVGEIRLVGPALSRRVRSGWKDRKAAIISSCGCKDVSPARLF
jgi:hypothetical protein